MNRSRSPRAITLEEAALQLGVHYMTVYRYVRIGKVTAQFENGRWWLSSADLESLAEPRSSKGVRGENTGWSTRQRRLLKRLSAGDLNGAWSIVEGALQAGRPPIDIYVKLIGPVMRQIGTEWAAGTRSVDSEHRASAIAVRLVGRVSPLGLRPGRRRRATVVIGGAPGDPHQLPVLMVADSLRWAGFSVIDLGADVPASSYIDAVDSAQDLTGVGISLSVDAHREEVFGVLTELRRHVPSATLLLGGPEISGLSDAISLGADTWAPHAGLVPELIEVGATRDRRPANALSGAR